MYYWNLVVNITFRVPMQKSDFFYDRGSYHIETSQLICRANQWTGFFMTETSTMKELKV